MQSHLKRKYPCKPLLRDINLDEYRHAILNRLDFSDTHFQQKSIPNMHHFDKKNDSLTENPKKCIGHQDTTACMYCGRSYKHRYTLNRHVKSCYVKREQSAKINTTANMIDELQRQIKQQNDTIQTQTIRIEALQTSRALNPEHVFNSTNITSNNTNNHSLHININIDKNRRNYRDTDYSILTDQDIQYAISHTKRCLQEIIPLIHFNECHPENQNIYISCLKSANAMLFEDSKWNAHVWSDVADRIIDDNIVTLQEWIRKNGHEYPHLEQKFRIFMDEKEGNNDAFTAAIKREMKIILYNNRKLIHSDEMVQRLQYVSHSDDFDKKMNENINQYMFKVQQ